MSCSRCQTLRPKIRPMAQEKSAKIVVGERIDVDESLLRELHDGDRGEGLGDGATGKTVSGLFDARSARPCVWKDSSDPLRTTPSAKPRSGWRLRISSTLVFISSPSMSGAALPPRSPSLIISDVMLIVTSVP